MENKRTLFLRDRFRKIDFCIDLIANIFRHPLKKTTTLFSIFSSFVFCFIIYLFEKQRLKGTNSCVLGITNHFYLKDSFNYLVMTFGWLLMTVQVVVTVH